MDAYYDGYYTCGCVKSKKDFWEEIEEPLKFYEMFSLCKHIRRHHGLDVRFSGEENLDAHGHCAYCFKCEGQKTNKNHRSFNSEGALLDHIDAMHGWLKIKYTPM